MNLAKFVSYAFFVFCVVLGLSATGVHTLSIFPTILAIAVLVGIGLLFWKLSGTLIKVVLAWDYYHHSSHNVLVYMIHNLL